MKQASLVLLAVLIISCNQNTHTQNKKVNQSDKRNYATELLDNDFLKYADSSKVDSLKTQIINSFNIYKDDNFKIAHIDAEELGEFSFDFFLPSLNKILAKRNLKLSAKKLNDNESLFDVLINGDTIQLYSKAELDNNSFLDKAPRIFFKKVNEILTEENSEELFYLLYAGNDLHILLLTEKQFLIIADYYKHNEKEKPYKP